MISTKNHAMFSIIIRIYKVVKIIKHSPIYRFKVQILHSC
jgi:hypothetical protein